MKKTSKVISIILSVFMLMQMMTGVVFASGKTKLSAPTNVRLVYDEDYEEYMYKFTAQIPSGISEYEYGLCVGGNVDGRVILSNPTEYTSSEPEFSKEYDVNEAFEQWKDNMGISDCKMLIGFCVISNDDNYSNSDIVVVDENAVVQNVNAEIGGKCNSGAYWTFSNGVLTYFGEGVAEELLEDWDGVSKSDIKSVVFESGITSFDSFTGFYDYPSIKSIYVYNRNFDPGEIFREARHNIALYAYRSSAVYSYIFDESDGRDVNAYFNLLDIETEDENYREAPSYADEVKIMSDCGVMPQIYSMYNKPVTKAELAKAIVRALESQLYIDKETSQYTDLTVGTFANGCANYVADTEWITPNTDTVFGANDVMTYGEVQEILVSKCMEIEGADSEDYYKTNIKLDKNVNDIITYEELASILLQAATSTKEGRYIFQNIPCGILFEGSISTRYEYNTWFAALNGKLKTYDNSGELDEIIVNDEEWELYDADLFEIEDDEIKLVVNNYDQVISGYYSTYDIVKDGKTYKADFTINDGASETNSKTVSLKLSAEGYTKYSIGGGAYKAITSSPVSYNLDSKHGEQSISVTFANDDLSKTKTVTRTIKLNNLHKVIYKADGKEFATVEVGCGLTIPVLDKTPIKEGYAFDGWENIPEIMPDNDITVNAKFIVEPPVASGTFNANDKAKWSLSKDGTLYISGTGSASVNGNEMNACFDLDYLFDSEKRNMVKKVVVGEGITELGNYVLYELYNAEEITLPSTLTKIGEGFMKGSSVKNVVIPANVTSFNINWSFEKCPSELKIYFMGKDIEFITESTSPDIVRNLNFYGYSGSEVETYAAENNCTFNAIDPDFAINNGAESTTDKNIKISLNDYAKNDFKQYKINDGEYKSIDANDIDFVLDNADGEKAISITFKNDNFEMAKVHKIIFNNKHKITYLSGDTIIDEATVGCGAKIKATDKIASKEGYTFLKWDVPEIMPDSDVVANAIFVKNADSEQLDTILTEQEKAEGISVKSDITVADENENIELALANKYSKYTASIIINIDLSKGKDENFTPITETENLLTFTVDIPTEIQNKSEYIVLREHNGTVDALTTSKNADGEYIEVKDNTIIIHAKKFSAYQLLAKDADPTPSRRGGGGGSSSYTVKFETNGAPAIKSVSVSRNNVITAPTAPVKDGFVFDGWYTDKEFKTKFDFATKITKSMTLYAKWTEKAKTSIILTIGKKDADINGKTVANDVAPKIVNDRTMLPIRFIAEALGAKVDWIEESQTVKITAENIDISLVIGETFATVNGEKIDLDSPSFIENDRTYLPIRFVSEKLGADVQWDDATQTVNITK